MVIFIPGILIYQRSKGMWSEAEYWLLLLVDCYVLYDQRFEEILRPAAVLFAGFCIQYLNTSSSLWKWLGSISYSLYLIHLPVGWSFMGMIKQYTQDETVLTLGLVGAVILSIGAAFLFYKLIESPSQKIAGKILARLASGDN
jgi:peptidoglycan/LPS O-acetylase OafA/YrhL